MEELKKHLDFLVSHAKSNAKNYSSYDGTKQDIEEEIQKAKEALTKLINNQ